jgi:hypothetical protein
MKASEAYLALRNYFDSHGNLDNPADCHDDPPLMVHVDNMCYDIQSIDFSDADDVYGNDAIYIRLDI